MVASVLAHIAMSIPHKENVATESLAFILNRSREGREALSAEFSGLSRSAIAVGHVGAQQSAGPESRPDLVLRSDGGKLQGFVEVKFWAPLTEAQPVSYLERLESEGAQLLVMLAPERRLASLRAEVVERCRASARVVEDVTLATARVGSCCLVFVSWHRVLKVLADAVVASPSAASDVRQLAGLCATIENDDFEPLTREDIDDLSMPRRALSLARLVDSIIERAEYEKLLSTKGLRRSDYIGGAGRYATFACAGCWIGLAHDWWVEYGHSPLWLEFPATKWGQARELRKVVLAWAEQNPARAYFEPSTGVVRIPLAIKPCAEKDDVVADAVRQLRELDALMRSSEMGGRAGGGPMM
jgi:hypothetical protein